ncbi:hypothetical protein PRO82_000602 [Candidatus Protochlamydia amoebophila]|nr:hypothetical protein [Candidatus Protochlamydia amoebophila]
MLKNKPSISLINFMFIVKPFLGANINQLASHLGQTSYLGKIYCAFRQRCARLTGEVNTFIF